MFDRSKHVSQTDHSQLLFGFFGNFNHKTHSWRPTYIRFLVFLLSSYTKFHFFVCLALTAAIVAWSHFSVSKTLLSTAASNLRISSARRLPSFQFAFLNLLGLSKKSLFFSIIFQRQRSITQKFYGQRESANNNNQSESYRTFFT